VWGIPATGVLAETLLDRGAESDVAEAEAAIEGLAAAPADDGLVIRDIWLLRLHAHLARAKTTLAVYGHVWPDKDEATPAAIGGVITARLASSDGNPAGAVRAKRP
jgi:hypothetical protein